MKTLIGMRNGEAYLGQNGSCSDFADYDSSAMWCHIFWILALSDSRITANHPTWTVSRIEMSCISRNIHL